MAEEMIDIRDLRDGNFLWLDKAALRLISDKAGIRGVTVYSWLCFYANIRGQDCFPSLKTLAKQCHVSSRTVMRTLKRLELIKVVAIRRKKGRGNVYQLLNVPTSDTDVTRVVTPVSHPPVTPMSHKQDITEQESFIKKTEAFFSKLWISPDLPYPAPTSDQIKQAQDLCNSLFHEVNLYRLIGFYRKQKGFPPPPDVLIRQCIQFKKETVSILNAWGWFRKTLDAQTASFFAQQHVDEHRKIKNEPTNIGDILAGIAKHGNQS